VTEGSPHPEEQKGFWKALEEARQFFRGGRVRCDSRLGIQLAGLPKTVWGAGRERSGSNQIEDDLIGSRAHEAGNAFDAGFKRIMPNSSFYFLFSWIKSQRSRWFESIL